jgi:protein-S-isoprenylcysteine O-methyltransferase Ste14/putative intracellular protease/amidase
MTVARQALKMRIRTMTLSLTGCALAFGVSVALAGYIGFSQSMRVMTAPAPDALVSSVVPLPPPVHDPHKPTVAVLLGNTLSEPTDVLGPYAMFAESGEYNVYTVAASRTVRTLTGGLDLVPHLSFEQLAARLHGDPDIVVVPQIVDIRASINAPVVAWVKQQGRGHALLFSWCTGAEVLAESGALDGQAATAHWGDIDRLQRIYPRVHWKRGVRYVDGGALLSTAGLTAGVDATLHLLARRHGADLAARVAEALHLPPSPFVESPKCPQFEFGPADAIFLLNAGFRWPKPRLSVWLYDGVGELDLGSVLDVYGISAVYRIQTRSAAGAVVSRHGIQFVPREQVRTLPPMGRPNSLLPAPGGAPGVALPREGSRHFAYIAALEDLARHQDAWTATFAAKRLEIRTPLRIEGHSWSIGVVLAPLFIGCATVAFLFWLKRAVGKQRQSGLELKVPPVALGVIAAALMWCARAARPDLEFPFPSTAAFPLGIALVGALTCLAGVASFRRAKTTVNPMKPDSSSSLVVSGIYRYTRNPMYLGFLLILLAWAAALSNILALVWLPVFVVYMNRFQISPEERVLASRFAQDYAEYRAKARRWL